jgi:hypothetical protein
MTSSNQFSMDMLPQSELRPIVTQALDQAQISTQAKVMQYFEPMPSRTSCTASFKDLKDR